MEEKHLLYLLYLARRDDQGSLIPWFVWLYRALLVGSILFMTIYGIFGVGR